MQSRALPFNGAVGCVSYMGQATLSGASLTSPTLNLDADSIYEFEGSVKLGASADLRFFFNADTTSANYDRCVITVTAPSTPVALNANNSILRASGSSGDVVRFVGKIFKDIEGHPCVEINYSVLSTSSLLTAKTTIVWRTTGALVTSFQINQSAGSLTSGQMYVFKKSPLIALNNATNLDVTANPSNPVHLQRVRRTNLTFGPAWIYYDATLGLWLTEQEWSLTGVQEQTVPLTTSGTGSRVMYPARADYQMYLTRVLLDTFAPGTNNGSNYWNFQLQTFTPANSVANVGSSPNTSADSTTTLTNHDMSINSVINNAVRALWLNSTKTGAPGSVYVWSTPHYRLVIP